MSNYIENVLQRLLVPDSSIIKQATKQLMEYFVSEKCVFGLFEVLKSSSEKQNRVYAATLLRKKVKNWKTLKSTEKIELKANIVQVLLKEPEESVRKQIMWLIASLYKYSFKSNQEWTELLTFINELILSESSEQHLSGVFMLSILNEDAAEQMKPHYLNMFKIFSRILSDQVNLKSAFYVLSCLKSIIPYTDETELNDLVNLLPHGINSSVKIIKTDQNEETVTTIFDFFQSLIEYDIPMISPYIKDLTVMVLEFIRDASLMNPTRICAMNFLNVLIETQKAALLKGDMIRPIVDAVFTIMCTSEHPLQTKSNIETMLEDMDDETETECDDTENLFTNATQVLDYCALYFPAKRFITVLIDYVSPAVTSPVALNRRAALAALAITSEGCADYYRNNHLPLLIDLCLKGMLDESQPVVQLGYFALCQFSEYLQPNFEEHAERIMKHLIMTIESKPELLTISRMTIRFYDALQSVCENLGEALIPFLPDLMAQLMKLQSKCEFDYKAQRLIIATFSSIVCSTKSEFNPYFDMVVEIIKPFLSYTKSPASSDAKQIQIECIDLMGVFAKFIGKDKFGDQLIVDCLSFVQNILINDNDPEIRSGAYDLLAGLTSKLEERLDLKQIMPQILETLKSEEGINILEADGQKTDLFSAFDEIELSDNDMNDDKDEEDLDDEEDEGEMQKCMIDNEYVAEKLSAIYCIEEVAKYLNPQLIDFYNDLHDELKRLSLFVNASIRKESYIALANLISYFHDYCICNLDKADETLRTKMVATFNSNLADFHDNSVKAITMDANRQLVMSTFEGVRILLQKCAPFIKQHFTQYAGNLEQYGNLILETFDNKIYCQMENKDEEVDEDLDDNLAEYDYMLKEYAGDIIPSLALCLPQEYFNAYFEKACVYLIKILNKSESSAAEKSFSIGVVGETLTNLDTIETGRAQKLFTEFYKHILSIDNEIKSNTIFTLGMLCSQSGNSLQQYYPQIVNDLMETLKHEKCKQTLDNICGTLCRIFLACMAVNLQNINYEMLLKAIFELVPLKVDHNEYMTFFTFVSKLMTNSILQNYYPKIIELSGHVLVNRHYECKKGIRESIVQVLKYFFDNYKSELDILLGQMKPDLANAIKMNLGVSQ